MYLYQKEYKYLNTETGKMQKFRAYDFFQHFIRGLVYGNNTTKRLVAKPVEKLHFKLEDEKNMCTFFDYTKDQSFHRQVNRITIKDNTGWVWSDSGWVSKYQKILFDTTDANDGTTIGNRNEKLRKRFADHFLKNKKALVIAHVRNFPL